MTKLSQKQMDRLKELYAAYWADPKRNGWMFSRDLRTDEALLRRKLVTRRGIPGDIFDLPEYAITRLGFITQLD